MVPGTATAPEAAFRGILYALWNARRLGYRRVTVHSDSAGVVAQINGVAYIEPRFVGSYLEVRALLHAYRSAGVELGRTECAAEALAMVGALLDGFAGCGSVEDPAPIRDADAATAPA